jgi:hypothetical protein
MNGNALFGPFGPLFFGGRFSIGERSINFVEDNHINTFLPSLVPSSPEVSEKKIEL